MLENYAANLHKGVPAGVFPHKLNACSFHYTTDCAALFSLDALSHMQPEALTLLVLSVLTSKIFFKNISVSTHFELCPF